MIPQIPGWMKWMIIGCFIPFSQFVYGQHQEVNDKPEIWKNQEASGDTQKLMDVFKRGHISGHFRSFFMNTQNAGALKDDYALAMGGGLKFESKTLYGFQLGLSGVYVFNVASSALLQSDSLTGQNNRYELGLFDISPRDNNLNVSRLEELYLRWKNEKLNITLGKQHINTPFINLQDGRMRPTAVDGIWVEWKPRNELNVVGGYLYGMSPRSTSRYFSIENSIGLYPSGVDTAGKPSTYKGNLQIPGIAYAGLMGKIGKSIRWQSWQMWVMQLYYSSLYQWEGNIKTKGRSQFLYAAQLIYQKQVGGGNQTKNYTYIDSGASSLVYGGKVGLGGAHGTLHLAYTHITAMGRYLLPREWGRDPFFTFMARERNEGFGDLHAMVVQWSAQTKVKGLKYTLALGYFDLPDVKNFALNKYGMPSYWQGNLDVRYSFGGFLKGLESQLLYLHKWKTGEDYGNLKYVYNKVDMSNLNVVLNFYF